MGEFLSPASVIYIAKIVTVYKLDIYVRHAVTKTLSWYYNRARNICGEYNICWELDMVHILPQATSVVT